MYTMDVDYDELSSMEGGTRPMFWDIELVYIGK